MFSREISSQESVTPTSGIQPMPIVEEIATEEESKKDDVISTSATATPPVQEIRYQSNPYVNTVNAPATPTLSVMGYAPPQPTFTAPLESAGTIYHTGVRNSCQVKPFIVSNLMRKRRPTNLKLFFCFIHLPSF